jgi:hypothetical protein
LALGDCGESGIVPLACFEEIDLMSESFSAFREQYLRRHENPVNGALRTVADVVEMISRKLRACTISEAARRPRQAQASTA